MSNDTAIQKTIAIWDIDGTLADDSLKDVMRESEYYTANVLRSLPPISNMFRIARELQDKGVRSYFVTGRMDKPDIRKATKDWLEGQSLKSADLIMRPEDVSHSQISAFKRKAVRHLLTEHQPEIEDLESEDTLRMVLCWDDNLENLTHLRAVLGPTNLQYVLSQVTGTAEGFSAKVVFKHMKSQKDRPKMKQPDIEYTMSDQKGFEDFLKMTEI
jgi:hypothetical protein